MCSGKDDHAAAPKTAPRMASAARRFLELLSPQQRTIACFPFVSDERYVWSYTPGERGGLRLKDMTAQQRTAAFALLDAALSAHGSHTAQQIIALETILREKEELEGVTDGAVRDPELYYFTLFGDPGNDEAWSWRANGHHLALHFCVVANRLVSPTPLFLGANPAEVRHGTARGLRVLAAEEDAARSLLSSLDSDQKEAAIVDAIAPKDILSRNYHMFDPNIVPRGIRVSALHGDQRERLVALIKHYTGAVADELAGNAWVRIEQAGLEEITFAWAGSEERGKGHYYAVRGSTFVIEYDNTQNDGNHVHAVWRDFQHDWNEDVLAQHYEMAHRY